MLPHTDFKGALGDSMPYKPPWPCYSRLCKLDSSKKVAPPMMDERAVPIAQPVWLWKWSLSLSLMVVLFGYREALSSPRNRDSQTG